MMENDGRSYHFAIFADLDLTRILNSADFQGGLIGSVSPPIAQMVDTAAWHYVSQLAYRRPPYAAKIKENMALIERRCRLLCVAIAKSQFGGLLTVPTSHAVETSDDAAALAALATRIGAGDPDAGVAALNQWRFQLEGLSNHAKFVREEQGYQPVSEAIGLKIQRPSTQGSPSGSPKEFVHSALKTLAPVFPKLPSYTRDNYRATEADQIRGPFVTVIKGILGQLSTRLTQDPDLRPLSELQVLRPKNGTIADWIDDLRKKS